MPVDQHQVDAFERDGVVILRGVFSDWIETLRAGVEFNMNNPGPFGREYNQPGEAGRFFGDYCNWQRIPEYHDFMFNSPAAEIATQLMHSKQARMLFQNLPIFSENMHGPWRWSRIIIIGLALTLR